MATERVSLAALRPFQLEGVRDTGETIGDGSYATVKELDFRGLKCVGKKIHDVLYKLASPQEKVDMLERFASECELLSQLHHPCIVQFLGVYFESDSQLPVMVMEYLHTTLSACLDKGVLPEEISYEILLDVVLGLRYLHEHSPPIVHRDLSANNVLLATNMSAKISDLGVAKILNLNPIRMGQMTQTQTPGTPCYMPPEAMIARPKYTNKVDIFSFGVMMVHILSGRWPIPGEAFREDPNNPDSNIPLSEFERRAEYLHGISRDHPLMGLIRQCLNNVQSRRPDAAVIHEQIKTVLAGFTPSNMNHAEMLQQIRFLSEMHSAEGNAPRLEDTTGSQGEIESLQAQIKSLQEEVKRLSVRKEESQPLNSEHQQAEVERLSVRKEESQPSNFEPQQTLPPGPQLKLRWRKCADIPIPMAHPHVVRIGDDIYAGGGYSVTHSRSIFKYSTTKDMWSALPKCPTQEFGLTELDGKPVLVGGIIIGSTPTGNVYTLEDSQVWRSSLPPLPTARFYPTVFRYKSFIIACGGITHWIDSSNYTRTTAVEVFSSETSQWYEAEPLPIAMNGMSRAIIDDTCYLIGGDTEHFLSNQTFCAFLPSLIQQATEQADPQSPTASQFPPPTIWRELTDCSCIISAAAVLGDSLLAIGGQLPRSNTGSTLVHLYSPDTNWWQRMPSLDIPEPLYDASTTQLANGDIILIGGRTGYEDLCDSVFIGN